MENPKTTNASKQLRADEDLLADAIAANDGEHAMSIAEAFCRYPKAVFWAVAMSFTIIMEGYDTILLSSLFAYPPFVERYGTYYPELGKHVISGSWQVGLGVASQGGAIIGLAINGFLTERYGHRLVTAVGLVVLSAFVFLSFFAPNIHVLLVGQLLIGIPWGIFAIMGSAYSSEVCPLPLRVYLTSFVNICWVIGQLIAAGVLQGLVNNTTQWAYRIPFAVQWAWPLPLLVVSLLAPDSPWWLVRRGRLDDAAAALRRLCGGRGPHYVSEEQLRQRLAMMVHTNAFEQSLRAHDDSASPSLPPEASRAWWPSWWSSWWSSWWPAYRECFQGTNLRRTEIACMVLSAQSLPGQAMCYSASYLFTQAGLSPADSYKLNFGSYGVAFVATCISWGLMTVFGRRTLICTGLTLLTLDLLIIGLLSYAATDHQDQAKWAQSILAIVWLGIYSSCLGPESFALAAEISSTRLRSQTISIARNAYNVVNIVNNTIEPYLINPTEANLRGKTALFWFGLAVLTTLWSYFRLPETRSRTYEELDVLFERKVPAWKFSQQSVGIVGDADGEDRK